MRHDARTADVHGGPGIATRVVRGNAHTPGGSDASDAERVALWNPEGQRKTATPDARRRRDRGCGTNAGRTAPRRPPATQVVLRAPPSRQLDADAVRGYVPPRRGSEPVRRAHPRSRPSGASSRSSAARHAGGADRPPPQALPPRSEEAPVTTVRVPRPRGPRARRDVPVLGVTGAPGSGKSAAAACLRELGCVVHDVDRMGHEALDEPVVRDAVSALLRNAARGGVLRGDGTLDRAAVAKIVFADPARLAELEAIVHPHVAASLERRLAAPAAAGTRAVVVDCALLFESGLDRLCDATVCVHADRPIRASRVRASRGWDDAELLRRESAQLSAETKRARADRVLTNEGGIEDLRISAARLLDDLLKDHGRTKTPAARNAPRQARKTGRKAR